MRPRRYGLGCDQRLNGELTNGNDCAQTENGVDQGLNGSAVLVLGLHELVVSGFSGFVGLPLPYAPVVPAIHSWMQADDPVWLTRKI